MPIALPTALLLALLLAGCAAMTPPQPGQSRDAVVAHWGAPSGRYALPEGAERLEYAAGPFGRTTWMVDVGRDGRVQAVRQVLLLWKDDDTASKQQDEDVEEEITAEFLAWLKKL